MVASLRPLYIAGVFVGIWGLAVLGRPHVIKSFHETATAGGLQSVESFDNA